MPQRYELKQIAPGDVDFSEFNPRAETVAQIEADPTFEQLKDSVFKYGVLVPIVVHRNRPGLPGKQYRLVDGERRLRAALATKTRTIPAHIASGEAGLDDLVQAFHIHMLRKQWKAVAQAKALKKIIDELKKQGKGNTTIADLLEQLRIFTGCTETRLKALRRVIRFPEAVLQEVDDGSLNFSHLVQIEESFMEVVKGKFPELMSEINERHARQVLVKKAQKKTLTSTRALMENVAPVVARASTDAEKTYAKQLLRDFVGDEEMAAETVLQRYEHRFPTSTANVVELGNEVVRVADYLTSLIERVDTIMAKGHPALTRKVHQHLQTLRAKLATAIRRINRAA